MKGKILGKDFIRQGDLKVNGKSNRRHVQINEGTYDNKKWNKVNI